MIYPKFLRFVSMSSESRCLERPQLCHHPISNSISELSQTSMLWYVGSAKRVCDRCKRPPELYQDRRRELQVSRTSSGTKFKGSNVPKQLTWWVKRHLDIVLRFIHADSTGHGGEESLASNNNWLSRVW